MSALFGSGLGTGTHLPLVCQSLQGLQQRLSAVEKREREATTKEAELKVAEIRIVKVGGGWSSSCSWLSVSVSHPTSSVPPARHPTLSMDTSSCPSNESRFRKHAVVCLEACESFTDLSVIQISRFRQAGSQVHPQP